MSKTIQQKIQAILAKAESSTHPEEADSFMAKAAALLEQHGLSMADLGTINQDDPVGATYEASYNYASEPWFKMLCGQIARYYGCRIVITRVAKNKYSHTLAGRESARTTYLLMTPFIKKQVLAAATRLVKEGHCHSRSIAQRQVGQALSLRIYEMIKERAPAPGPSGENALVPVDAISAKLDELFPNRKQNAKKRGVSFSLAAQDAASKVSLDQQVHTKRRERLA